MRKKENLEDEVKDLLSHIRKLEAQRGEVGPLREQVPPLPKGGESTAMCVDPKGTAKPHQITERAGRKDREADSGCPNSACSKDAVA